MLRLVSMCIWKNNKNNVHKKFVVTERSNVVSKTFGFPILPDYSPPKTAQRDTPTAECHDQWN